MAGSNESMMAGSDGGLLQVKAMRAGNALAVVRRLEICGRQGSTTDVALRVATLRKITIHCDAGIKYETFAFPAILVRRHLSQIFQDSTLQVIYLVESQLEH